MILFRERANVFCALAEEIARNIGDLKNKFVLETNPGIERSKRTK